MIATLMSMLACLTRALAQAGEGGDIIYGSEIVMISVLSRDECLI
jgi:hypothetical protein